MERRVHNDGWPRAPQVQHSRSQRGATEPSPPDRLSAHLCTPARVSR